MLPKLRLVMVGDPRVGKTMMALSLMKGAFPEKGTIPTYSFLNDFYVTCEGKSVLVSLEDTYSQGSTEFVKYRRLVYPHTDVLLVCFSLASRASFDNVETTWVPEVTQYCPNVPIILVGNKLDLRYEAPRDDSTVVSQLDGVKLARRIGAFAYAENSALTREGLQNVFEIAVSAVLSPDRPPRVSIFTLPKPAAPAVLATDLPLSRALGPFIDTQQFADLTFVLSDKQQVHAHKVILATNLPSFYKTLLKGESALPSCFKLRPTGPQPGSPLDPQTSAQWSRTERTIIDTDLDSLVLHCILKSIYTGTDLEFSSEVVTAAVQFFTQCPRFSSKEREQILTELARDPSPPLSDVCFQIGKHRVCAHKVLLTAVSEYFGAIFTSGLKESQLDVIPLHDIDREDFALLKEFLYTARTDSLHAHNVSNVIRLANKYNFSALITHCEVVCKDNIDAFDVWELYQLATAHNCHQLRAYLIWLMTVQYDAIHDQTWFKKELESDVQQQVTREQWPGSVYHAAVQEWEKELKTRVKSSRDCAIM